MLTSHNFGKLSDQVYTSEDDVGVMISFTTTIWTFTENGELFLSKSFKEKIPIEGNRVCKIRGSLFYLTINKGILTNKKRI